MLGIIITVLEEAPITSPQAVEVIARGLAGIIKKGSELSPSAQVYPDRMDLQFDTVVSLGANLHVHSKSVHLILRT